MIERILVVGATGNLAPPVVRQLIANGFHVRALVRDVPKAAALLPPEVECVSGDLRDRASLDRALDGMDAVYANLSSPTSPQPYDPMRDGTLALAEAAGHASIERIGLITSQGVCPEAESWWVIACKARAEEAVRSSGIPYTIFRPTWFMESLSAFIQGGTAFVPNISGVELYWIAGEDYGQQVANAFRRDEAANKSYVLQGPEPVTIEGAVARYLALAAPHVRIRKVPLGFMRVAGWFKPDMRFLHNLMLFTRDHHLGFHATETWRQLGEPHMRIEDYVASEQEHGKPKWP